MLKRKIATHVAIVKKEAQPSEICVPGNAGGGIWILVGDLLPSLFPVETQAPIVRYSLLPLYTCVPCGLCLDEREVRSVISIGGRGTYVPLCLGRQGQEGWALGGIFCRAKNPGMSVCVFAINCKLLESKCQCFIFLKLCR